MKLSTVPENLLEWVALKCNVAPTPILDTLVALLLAKMIIAATAMKLFDVLEGGPLTLQNAGRSEGPTSKMNVANSR